MTVVEITSADQFDLVLKSNACVVVDFHATWCGPCKVIKPKFEQLSDEYTGKVAFAKVDVDSVAIVAAKYSVSAMPTFLFFKNGQKVDELVGADLNSLKSKIQALSA